MGRGGGVTDAQGLSWNQELKMPGLKIPDFKAPASAPEGLPLLEPVPLFNIKEHLSKLSGDSLPKIPMVKMPENNISLDIKENKPKIVRKKKAKLHGLMSSIVYN